MSYDFLPTGRILYGLTTYVNFQSYFKFKHLLCMVIRVSEKGISRICLLHKKTERDTWWPAGQPFSELMQNYLKISVAFVAFKNWINLLWTSSQKKRCDSYIVWYTTMQPSYAFWFEKLDSSKIYHVEIFVVLVSNPFLREGNLSCGEKKITFEIQEHDQELIWKLFWKYFICINRVKNCFSWSWIKFFNKI